MRVFLKLDAGLTVAAVPRRGTEELHALLLEVYPGLTAAGSVFQTTLAERQPRDPPGRDVARTPR